jgi:hypothetical protein
LSAHPEPAARSRRRLTTSGVLLLGCILAVAAGISFATGSGSGEAAASRRAAIVDQLALTSPDQPFIDEATATLKQAGYAVDYYPSDQVTVDFYRDLPTHGYGLILVRAHSGFALKDSSGLAQEVRGQGETFVFTSEPYSQDKYLQDQRDRRLSVAFYFDLSGVKVDLDAMTQAYKSLPRYFGVKPGFIASSSRGKFDKTTVILMGCNGLASNALAKAFASKGAQAVVGWDDLVSASHTDAATERLLTHLVVEGAPVQQAVASTMAEVGPDPTYGGKLLVYLPGPEGRNVGLLAGAGAMLVAALLVGAGAVWYVRRRFRV